MGHPVPLLLRILDRYVYPALLLGLRYGWREVFEGGEMTIDVVHGVCDGERPLLVPPVGLRHNSAIDHAEPVEAPEVGVDGEPLTVVANLLRIEEQRSVRARALDVALDTVGLHDLVVAGNQSFADFGDVGVTLGGEDMMKGGETGGHDQWIGSVGSSVEDLVLRDH